MKVEQDAVRLSVVDLIDLHSERSSAIFIADLATRTKVQEEMAWYREAR